MIVLLLLLGDVFCPNQMLRVASWCEDDGGYLPLDAKSLTSMFNLNILEDEGTPWSSLCTSIVEKGSKLFCTNCQEESFDKLSDYEEYSNYHTITVTKSMARGSGKTLQKFWDHQAHFQDDYCEMNCEKCGKPLLRFIEKKVLVPRHGLMLYIDKSRVKKLSYQVEEELKIRNWQPKLHGDTSFFSLVGGIEEIPKEKKDVEDSFELSFEFDNPCLEDFGSDPPKGAFNQFVFHWRGKDNQYFKIHDSDKIGTSSQENLQKCQFLFFYKKSQE